MKKNSNKRTDAEKIELVERLMDSALKEQKRIVDDALDKLWEEWLKDDKTGRL